MKKMYAELRDKGLEIFGITTYYGYFKRENLEKKDMPKEVEFAKLKDHLDEYGLPWPLIVADKSNFEHYGVGGIPHYVVIDQRGKVASYVVGFNEPLHAELRGSVEKLLNASVAAR